MKKIKIKEHCPTCNAILDNVNNSVETDVSEKLLLQHDIPWDGNYYVEYKICPICGEKVETYSWHRTFEGYSHIINLRNERK